MEEKTRSQLVEEIKKKDDLLSQILKVHSSERLRHAQERKQLEKLILKFYDEFEYQKNYLKIIEEKIDSSLIHRPNIRKSLKSNANNKPSKVVTLFNKHEENPEKDIERLRKLIRKDPLEGKNILHRIYIKLFKPELLRKAN